MQITYLLYNIPECFNIKIQFPKHLSTVDSPIGDDVFILRLSIPPGVQVQCERNSTKTFDFVLSTPDDGASPVPQLVKNISANARDARDTVRSLSQEVPLEKETATQSSILAWKIPWTKKPGGLQSMGSQRVKHD